MWLYLIPHSSAGNFRSESMLKHWLASGLAFVFICSCLCQETVRQEPNAREMAAPCKLAGQQAEEVVNGATTTEAYLTALTRLRATADTFIAKTGETEEASLHCLNYYGAALISLGELAQASRVYRRALNVAKMNFEPGDDSILTLQGNLAIVLFRIDGLDEADRLLKDTLAHRESLAGTPKAHKLAITLLNLAMVESALGQIVEARSFASRGFTLAQKSIPSADQRWGTILHEYAMVLDQGGARSEGQKFFEQSLAVSLKNGDSGVALDTLASLAASFYDAGRVEEADQRYKEAYDLAGRTLYPLHPVRAQIARSWCRVLSSENKLDESLSKCDEAIQILSAHGEESRVQVYLSQVNRGVTLGLLNRKSDAISTLSAAVHDLGESVPPSSPELQEGIRSLGLVLVDAGRGEEGVALLSDSLRAQRALFGDLHPDVLLTQGNYGVALAMQGKLPEAEAVLTDYATKADTVRGLYGQDARTTRGVFSRFASTRMFLAKLLVGEGRCQVAFDWMEDTKARSLRDQIRDRVSIDAATAENRELFESLEQARTRLYTERAQSIGDGAKQTEIDVRLRSIDERIGNLVDTARSRQVATARPETPSAAILRTGIPADTTIAAFGLAEDEVVVVSYRAGSGFQCTSLGQWKGLNETIWATRALQSAPGGMTGLLAGTTSTPASRVLRTGSRSFALIPRSSPIPQDATAVGSADELLGTVGQELMGWLVKKAGTTSRLVLSPDGLLNLVAFDALSVDGGLLVYRFSISEVDSFAAPLSNDTHQFLSKNQRTMIALGDAIYSSPGVASSTSVSAEKASLTIRGDADETANWPPLPASAVELRTLSSLFKLVPGRTVFTREAANAQTVRTLNKDGSLAKARYLIFSAHAFADVTDPELSSIVLSVPLAGKQRDAYVTATDIAALKLNSDLVFFSACETGFGQVVSGEGVLSLASAALVAGSRSTIDTLWSVVDQSSAEFTKRFFTDVRNGIPPEQALTRTKRAFAPHVSPAYWAPYVLVR